MDENKHNTAWNSGNFDINLIADYYTINNICNVISTWFSVRDTVLGVNESQSCPDSDCVGECCVSSIQILIKK